MTAEELLRLTEPNTSAVYDSNSVPPSDPNTLASDYSHSVPPSDLNPLASDFELQKSAVQNQNKLDFDFEIQKNFKTKTNLF